MSFCNTKIKDLFDIGFFRFFEIPLRGYIYFKLSNKIKLVGHNIIKM